MDKLVGKAYAKVNLYLNVVGKREDGFHLLQMLNVKIGLFDLITIEKQNDAQIIIADKPVPLNHNIVKDVATYMQKRYSLCGGMRITIEKNIPIAAGLGGGSADCAAVLHMINEMYALDLNQKTLEEIGVRFGADVSYCLTNEKAFVEGIGEKVTPVMFTTTQKVLVIFPNMPISTKEIFLKVNEFSPKIRKDEFLDKLQHGLLNSLMKNDLQKLVFASYPQLERIVIELNTLGISNVQLSGSGSTLFALIKPEREKELLALLRKHYPDYHLGCYHII